jgi:hypothetical protein
MRQRLKAYCTPPTTSLMINFCFFDFQLRGLASRSFCAAFAGHNSASFRTKKQKTKNNQKKTQYCQIYYLERIAKIPCAFYPFSSSLPHPQWCFATLFSPTPPPLVKPNQRPHLNHPTEYLGLERRRGIWPISFNSPLCCVVLRITMRALF